MVIIEKSTEVNLSILERCITRRDIDGKRQEVKFFKTFTILSVKNYSTIKITYNFKYINWCEKSQDNNGKETRYPMLPLMVFLILFLQKFYKNIILY